MPASAFSMERPPVGRIQLHCNIRCLGHPVTQLISAQAAFAHRAPVVLASGVLLPRPYPTLCLQEQLGRNGQPLVLEFIDQHGWQKSHHHGQHEQRAFCHSTARNSAFFIFVNDMSASCTFTHIENTTPVRKYHCHDIDQKNIMSRPY